MIGVVLFSIFTGHFQKQAGYRKNGSVKVRLLQEERMIRIRTESKRRLVFPECLSKFFRRRGMLIPVSPFSVIIGSKRSLCQPDKKLYK